MTKPERGTGEETLEDIKAEIDNFGIGLGESRIHAIEGLIEKGRQNKSNRRSVYGVCADELEATLHPASTQKPRQPGHGRSPSS